MAFTNIFIIGLVLHMELRGEGLGWRMALFTRVYGACRRELWSFPESFKECRQSLSMRCFWAWSLLGICGTWVKKMGNAWFGVVGLGLWVWAQWRHQSAPCSPHPSPSICPHSLQHNSRHKISIPWWQGTFRHFSHSCHLSTDP